MIRRQGNMHGDGALGRLFGAWALAAFLVLAWAATAAAYFQDLGLGVRPAGMGEAFTAVADDSNAVLYNIAGLADLKMHEFNAMYSDLFSNLNAKLYSGETDFLGYHNLGLAVAMPPQFGNFALFWTLFNSRLYRENTFILGYGRNLGADLWRWLGAEESLGHIRLDAGLNLKFLNWEIPANEYTAANPAFNQGLSRTGVTADVGFLATLPDNVKVGMSLENFIPANVGLTIYETVPINFRLGTSYLYDWQGKLPVVDSLLGAVDFTQRYGISDIRIGVEGIFLKHLFALRVGTTADQFTTGASFFTPLNYANFDLRLDYAFGYPYNVEATWGSHRFSVVLRWDGIQGAEEDKPKTVMIRSEENMASKRERELAEERARERAQYLAMMERFRQDIRALQAELDEIMDSVHRGVIPAIQFTDGRAEVRPESFPTLNRVGEALARHSQIKVRLEGYTDGRGQELANLQLSQARMESVKSYLGKHFPVERQNLLPVGYGAARPVASNDTPAGRAANRRVEFTVLVPVGLDVAETASAGAPAESAAAEPVRPENTIRYEELARLQEKLQVYELEVNPQEVEDVFQQQHLENGHGPGTPAP